MKRPTDQRPRTSRTLRWALAGVAGVVLASCYPSGGDGVSPPPNSFYFPVGLVVSRGGNVLYAINSDFDLQWNGGTLQSYDLTAIRRDTLFSIGGRPEDLAGIPYVEGRRPASPCGPDGTFVGVPPVTSADGTHLLPGELCAPAVRSETYVRDSVTIGAFATELQLSRNGQRLFAPVRGDATLTWADVVIDDPDVAPPAASAGAAPDYPPFRIDCGVRVDGRCDAAHHAGNNPREPGNTRQITMPGEPFGMAQSEDGTAIVVTHQIDAKASLFSTGLPPIVSADDPCPPASVPPVPTPSLQFVVDRLTPGGNGIDVVPVSPRAFASCEDRPRPSFLQTSRSVPELNLLRYYSDDGLLGPSDNYRPFLQRESVIPVAASAGGTDSRGIVIDPSPRIACTQAVLPADAGAVPPRDQAAVDRDLASCARIPARVFIANRSPASVLIGEVGESPIDPAGTYDPDRVTLFGNLPLAAGPSRLYLAPVVDREGNYSLRLFIVCFDSQTLFIYDPNANVMENVVRTGQGPFAMAFDPFDFEDVALKRPVPMDPRFPRPELRRYSFAYVASFTNSFVQVLDLDNSRTNNATYETIAFTLGQPTVPKGSR